MDFDRLKQVEGSVDRARALYEGIFTGEEERLAGQAASVERLTTLRVLKEELRPNSQVLDLGCGAGVYALPLAGMGHALTAIDPVPHHIAQLTNQAGPGVTLEARVDDALSALKKARDASFDAVLCLGPLYHLRKREERLACLMGINRVLKPGGKAFLAFLHNDWVIATMTLRDEGPDYLLSGDVDPHSFRVNDFPFVFHTLPQANQEAEEAGLIIQRRIASDGIAEMHTAQLNEFSKEQFAQWLRFHAHTCEKPEFLGASNHWLFVCEKGKGHAL